MQVKTGLEPTNKPNGWNKVSAKLDLIGEIRVELQPRYGPNALTVELKATF